LRLYVCKPGETALRPDNDQILVHNHKFDFQTQVLLGYVDNVVYEMPADQTAPAESWYQYTYESALRRDDHTMRLQLDLHRAAASASSTRHFVAPIFREHRNRATEIRSQPGRWLFCRRSSARPVTTGLPQIFDLSPWRKAPQRSKPEAPRKPTA
jgi:hypothetical protein